MHGALGIPFIAFAPFVGIAVCVYMFGKISIAHFNPAVTIGFLITKHITKIQLVYYLYAEIIGALLGSVFVKYVIGFNANLGANAPNYSFPIPIVFGIEVLATALLMAVIFTVVYTKGLRGFSGIAIGGIVGLEKDIFFLAFISGTSMNPLRSLAPATELLITLLIAPNELLPIIFTNNREINSMTKKLVLFNGSKHSTLFLLLNSLCYYKSFTITT